MLEDAKRRVPMSGHTPGPWELHVLDWGWIVNAPQESCQITRAPFDENALTNRRQLQDARLIAAAPELLERLKFAAHFLKSFQAGDRPTEYSGEALRRIQETIAKAEGR